VSSDITARKIAEKELIELNGTLEDRVVERTLELHDAHESLLAQVKQREIAEEQLRQAQKMEAIGHLTGGVAHDFNNLLMAVLGNLDLLRKHCANDPKATRLIDGALKGAQRGAALTQRLLAFARRQDLRVEPVDLIDLVRGMNDLLRRSVGSNIQLNYDLPTALPPVLADANQIELALLNLVVNSRDAISKSGEIGIGLQKMEVAASIQDLAAGTYVVMSVHDNGQGMTPETLERAIDPFFSTKELGKGTGLGLSMIHGLAVQLKGALRLSSSMGAGTKAELWLPISTGQKSSVNPGIEVSPEIVEAKFRILMVDDDALIAMSTVDMLEDLGHKVIEAHSGKDALEILQAGEEVDLLITDYSMPKMTGAELAKAARLLKPGLPVLIATGYADLPPGMDIDIPRLAKPYTQADLASHIAKALAN
jgi:signal transduction histidine kinase/CheY-like chemotaxis protein